MASFFDSMVAAQMASGGQNVITPENVNRIMSLAAQQEAQRRLALASGSQAVREKMEEQKMLGFRDGTLASEGRAITAPSGARFVTDAQGNVVGSSGVPTGRTVFQETEEGQVAGRGAGPTTTLGERIRSSFIEEMSRAAPAPAPAPRQAQAAAPSAAPMVLAASARPAQTMTETVTETETLPTSSGATLTELLRETERLQRTPVGQEPVATPEQKSLMKTVAERRRELGKLLPMLEKAVRENDARKAADIRNQIEDVRSNMLMAREQAYPGAISAAQRKATERKLEVGGFGVPGM